MNIPMNAKAFCLNGMFFDWESGNRLPDDYSGYVVDYSERCAKADDTLGAPVFETAINEENERVWVFVNWTYA